MLSSDLKWRISSGGYTAGWKRTIWFSFSLHPELRFLFSLPEKLLPVIMLFFLLTPGDFSRSRWSQLDDLPNAQKKKKQIACQYLDSHTKCLRLHVCCCGISWFLHRKTIASLMSSWNTCYSWISASIRSTSKMQFSCFFFPVSEAREGLGESETKTSGNSQLCGQGKTSSLMWDQDKSLFKNRNHAASRD